MKWIALTVGYYSDGTPTVLSSWKYDSIELAQRIGELQSDKFLGVCKYTQLKRRKRELTRLLARRIGT